jgi:hypothetical protein
MKKLLQMSSADGTLSDGVFTEAMEALDTVIARKHAEKGMLEGLECTIRMGGGNGHQNAHQGQSEKGRPRNTCLKSYETEMKNQVKKGSAGASKEMDTSTNEENPRDGKTKALNELLNDV